MDSETDNIYLHLQELFASYSGVMTSDQVWEERVGSAVQAAVFYGDVKVDGETYHWVSK